MKLDKYIQDHYSNNPYWFAEEIQQAHHIGRISKVLNNKQYLNGKLHKVLEREDITYKDKELKVSKMILQTAKAILRTHNSYIMGKKVSLTGTDNMVKEYNKVFRKGKYNSINYKVVKDLNQYGDIFEYVYYSNGKGTSKLISSEDGYPIYSDEGDYIGFIEHWTDAVSSISYYIVYKPNIVEKWTNACGNYILEDTKANITGLPIHYINGQNTEEENFGRSLLEDIKPILEKLEYLLNKMDDAITILSLNPIPYVSGQRVSGTIDADGIGYMINLEDGAEFKYAVAELDSNSIKILYNALIEQLVIISGVPSHMFGQSNIANVSEVSLKILYQNLDAMARELEVYLRDGLEERFEKLELLLNKKGIKFNDDDYIDIEFNYNRPIDSSEVIEQLSKQYQDGVISRRTYIEKSPLTNNVDSEIKRIEHESKDSKTEGE
ncbi:phage portal protein [Senegalia massiliensis]|uniref:Phage portal protein n=1 Tax=Senegalia massiliensis TaxID=1720316 RepID=A0A845QWG3_9CLOT|nr:phage portal protein [Senegalia massiliensis]NBI06621.1 phage portal protein [Senegalia massiliensis]